MIANKLNMNERQIRRVVGSLREAGLVELVQIRRRDPMTAEQKDRTRSTVLRIIDRLQSIGAETQ
jgi:predicted transcriptional regulator